MDEQRGRDHHRVSSSTTAWSPSSPASPSRGDSSLSRRYSWGRADAPPPSSAEGFISPRPSPGSLSPVFTDVPLPLHPPPRPMAFQHPEHPSLSQSQISLESPMFIVDDEEDRAHLTAPDATPWRHSEQYDAELEGSGDGMRRRPLRSPGERFKHDRRVSVSGSALKTVGRNIRRVSVRVVNFGGSRIEDRPVKLSENAADEPGPMEMRELEPPQVYDTTEKLRGKTLGIFGPGSRLRKGMHDLMLWRWTEPIILVLIIAYVVVLTLQASPNVFNDPRLPGYFNEWQDYALFSLFIIFTLEAFARIIVSGLVLDPETPISSLWRAHSDPANTTIHNRFMFFRRRLKKLIDLPHRSGNVDTTTVMSEKLGASTLSSKPSSSVNGSTRLNGAPKLRLDPAQGTGFVQGLKSIERPFEAAVKRQNLLSLQSRPYLRHGWTRLDFVAVVSYWIMFVLAVTGQEMTPYRHIFIFRALMVLRSARLLTITTGTTTIMNSLKRAGPLLVNVAFFVLFAMVLFSIIGVQSFRGNFRRACVFAGSAPTGDYNFTLSFSGGSAQICGGQIDPVYLNATGFYDVNYVQVNAGEPKGYICTLGQMCVEQEINPQGNMQSFDNVFAAAMQVVIVASANTWSNVMYDMMSADFFVSCLFFIICIIVLNFWLINMFVAVITNSFAATRAETAKSAFGADTSGPVLNENEREEGWSTVEGLKPRNNLIRQSYETIAPGFVVAILASLVVQATRTADMTTSYAALLDASEMAFTFVFDFEILWRLAGYFPNWRTFRRRRANIVDLTLAVVSTTIQIPPIHNSRVYAWLTVFQIARAYRVILAIPRMRNLLLQVFGSAAGLANMSLFLLLTNFIGALVASQLFRGDVPSDSNTPMNFNEMSISFLGMYQITSSENWTDVLYNVLSAEGQYHQAIIGAIFLCTWFLFANFIMLQMFIAVINENFSIAEEQKRAEQLAAYVRRQTEPTSTSVNWIDNWNPYRFLKAKPRSIVVENLPASLVLPMNKSLIRDNQAGRKPYDLTPIDGPRPSDRFHGFVGSVRRFFALEDVVEVLPLDTLRGANRDSILIGDGDDMVGNDRQFDLPGVNALAMSQEATDALYEQRAQKADFIVAHPSFDKSFWFLSQSNPFRRFCQTLVFPANGERIFGAPPSRSRQAIFQLMLFVAIIGGIVVAAVATPTYRRNFRIQYGLYRGTWYDISEAAFACVLLFEFIIKVIADGFIFTPNAYLLSVWNITDLVILLLLLVNVTTSLIVLGGINRLTRALKAFRALRLITLTGRIRETFHSVIFAGAMRIVDAALLAILYMIPYAIWGLNMFSGLLYSCNDGNMLGKDTCFNEFLNTPLQNDTLAFLAPRVWANPSTSTSWSFDNFGSSLLILFETVSLEGWIDVLRAGMAITSLDEQPQINSSEVNGIYFVIYNLMGAVVILTLFVSIIIANFSNRSGTALLTAPQRQWIDLQKLIRRQRPSRRPEAKPTGPIRSWCFDRAVQKHGYWSRGMTTLYLAHIIGLMTQTFEDFTVYEDFQNIFFLVLSLCYTVDILVRLLGLGWKSFHANGWNMFDVFVVAGSFATTVPALLGNDGFTVLQLQKLFLVSIAFKLVQKNDSLNQLFKTSVASLPAILNLFLLWMTLFFFFAILFVEVFGLTRWVSGETSNINYTTFGNALVMLCFMSTGEGWNQFMHDYAVIYPRCTNSSKNEPDSDCGSVGWAFTLFIAWNILSMYIFVNMFTGVVVESFSYVFQLSGTSVITRDQMRAFKEVWAEYDPERTGRISRKDFVSFFGKLTGVFEVKIYPSMYRTRNITEATLANEEFSHTGFNKIVHGIDMVKLQKALNGLDSRDIRQRRERYNRLYHEALLQDEENQGQGITFTNMLIMLAHYKLIDDNEALRLDETLKRQIVLERVNARVNIDRVKSMLRTIIYRRQFVAQIKEAAQRRRAEEHGIPAIIVETSPATPPLASRDISDSDYMFHDGDSPLQSPIPSPQPYSPDGSFAMSPMPSPQGLRHDRRVSDISMLSADLAGSPSPRSSHFFDEAATQQVISSLSTSLWGEMMQEAEEEDHD